MDRTVTNAMTVFTAVVFPVLCFLLLLGGCRQEVEQIQEESVPEEFMGTIVAVGDSLTAGLGIDEEFSYPAQLQQRLVEEGRKYRVINAGVSGETSSGTLSRLEWILTMKPDIVILEIGGNDGLRGIDPAVPRKNLDQILQLLRDRNVITILVGMKMVLNLGDEYTTEFNSIYPEIAAKYGLIFMPFFLHGVATLPELNTADGIHPNSDGYRVVVGNIYPYVIKAIGSLEKGRKSS